jgi:tetratricopeptide (TPR) repeat protein
MGHHGWTERLRWALRIGVALVITSVGHPLMAQGPTAPVPKAAYTPVELISPLGTRFYARQDSKGAVLQAERALLADPRSPDLVLALEQAQVSVWQYREAMTSCTQGIDLAPKNAEFFLERGHRGLGVREFEAAEGDLKRALKLDPTRRDAAYHLGLAHYFLGEWKQAASAFSRALDLGPSGDDFIDTSNWLYVSLRRAGRADEAAKVLAAVTPDRVASMPHIANYLKLIRLYQGVLSEREVLPPRPPYGSDTETELTFDSMAYGVGNWHLLNGEMDRADALFGQVVAGQAWAAWGFIGAEQEVLRARAAEALSKKQ